MKQTVEMTQTEMLSTADPFKAKDSNNLLKQKLDEKKVDTSDRLCLVPQRWMYLRIGFIILVLACLCGLIAIVFTSKGQFSLARITFIIILSALIVIFLIASVCMKFYQKHRLKKFNQTDHSSMFYEAYLKNAAVEDYFISDNNAEKSINAHLLPCTRIPGTKLNVASKKYKMHFKGSEYPLEYCVSRVRRFDDGSVKNLFNKNEDTVTAIVVRLPSLDYRTFFLAHNNFLTSTVEKRAVINKQEVSFVNGVKNMFYIFQNPDDLQIVGDFDKRFLRDVLFARDEKNFINFDLYNDSDVAYLIAYVPSWFGTIKLESNENILEFQKKCNKQAWYDIKLLKYINKAAMGLHDNLFRNSYKKKMIMLEEQRQS